jgi:hypothetical protein
MPIQRVFTATVAECIDPSTPNPAACRTANGNAQLVIDLQDSGTGQPWYSFMRFEPDTTLAGKTITKVTLRLVATTASNAPGPDSGSVFRVSAFTLASLSTTTPTKQDTTALAGDQGAVSMNETVDWSLPTTLVTAGSPVYLGLYPNDGDGVNYWNLDGTTPPRLVIDAQ